MLVDRNHGAGVGGAEPAPSAAKGGAPLLTRITALLRKIAGMPDYAAHLEHLRRRHPGQPVPSERQFYEEFVRTRYGDGPTRCC
jgi:uncharacterized short protein YbdD (DUF466 family)